MLPAVAPAESAEVASNFTQPLYEAAVGKCVEYIYAGDVIQVVNSQRFSRRTAANPFQVYRALRSVNPSPYMFFLDCGDLQLAGASPEMLLQIVQGRARPRPIAGTRPRGATPREETELERDLLADPKELAEHVMLVDLGRNDVSRVAEIGSVQVTQKFAVERYSHVMHLSSNVVGRLMPGKTAMDVLRATLPVGTLSGGPKIRAMEIIAELEPDRRNVYAGAVGYFDFSGNMDTAISIRTTVVKDGVAHVQAGGGIVYDSTPEMEYMETLHKASAIMTAIDQAEQEIDL